MKNRIEEAIKNNVSRDKTKYDNRSLYLDTEVYCKFTAFCNNHKEFSKKELITLALMEFMEKYK